MKVNKKYSCAKNDMKCDQGIWLRSRNTECTGQRIQQQSNRGNAAVTVNPELNQGTVAGNPKINENESTCSDHECWIVASKETKKSDLKLCLQKTGTSPSETVKMTSQLTPVQQRKRGRTEQHVELHQVAAGCEVQCNQIIPRTTTQRRGIKRRKQSLSYRKKQRQIKKTSFKNTDLPQEIKDLVTTEERYNHKNNDPFPKKRKIIPQKKTAKVKEEEERAVESLLADVFIKEHGDVSINCSVLISDVLMYDKKEDVPDVSGKVVTESNSTCGDVELLLPESITYLQKQFPEEPINITGTGGEAQDFRYADLLGSPNYSIGTFIDDSIGLSDSAPAEECDGKECNTDQPEYQQKHSSSLGSIFENMDTIEPKENENVTEISRLMFNDSFVDSHQVSLPSSVGGLQFGSSKNSNQQEDGPDQMIDLTTLSLGDINNNVTELCVESQSSDTRCNQAPVQLNYDDSFGNVVVANIIICPAEICVLEEVNCNDELQYKVEIRYKTLDKELSDVISGQQIHVTEGRQGGSSVNDSVLQDNTGCDNHDQNDDSFGKTCQHINGESRGMLPTDHQESESSCCEQTQFLTSENDVSREDEVISRKGGEMACEVQLSGERFQKVVDDVGDTAGRVDTSSAIKSCHLVPNNDQCCRHLEKGAVDSSSQKHCMEERCEDPSGSHEDDTANDSLKTMRGESHEESESEIITKPTSNLYSLSLLQEYSSDESDDDESSPEIATDDNVDCGGSICVEGVDTQLMEPTVHQDKCADCYEGEGKDAKDCDQLMEPTVHQDKCADCYEGEGKDAKDCDQLMEPTVHQDKCADCYEGEGKDAKDCDLEDLDILSVHCDSIDLFLSDDENSSNREIPVKDFSSLIAESGDAKDTDINKQPAEGERPPVESLSTGSLQKSPESLLPLKRRVVDVRSRHLSSFQPSTVTGSSFRGSVMNQDPHRTILKDYHPRQKFNYPGESTSERLMKSLQIYADTQMRKPQLTLLQTSRCPEIQRGWEGKCEPRRCYGYRDEFHANRRIVVSNDPHQLILGLVRKGLFVQAWREIVHYGLYQEIDTQCLEDIAISGCTMMSDNAWQMVMEVLTELKYNVTCNLPVLCFKLIKMLCNINDMNRAIVIFNYMPFPMNGLVPMEILDQLLDGLLSTSKWKAARDVIGQLLYSGLQPPDYVLGRILQNFYDDSDSQGIYELLKLLQDSGMQRTHPIYQNALRLLRRLQLNTRCDYHDAPLQSSEQMKLLEPQNIKELINAIWDCPNGLYVGQMCTTFFEMWSVEASCSSALQQEICSYLTRVPEFQAAIFADFISELDKARKISSAFRETCTDLFNGLLLEALALDDKILALHIIFPSMESHFIPIYDKGLASLIDLLWNAGTAATVTARRLFGLRCQNGFLCKHNVQPFEVVIQSTWSRSEMFFTFEKFLLSHKRFINHRTYYYNVRVIIQHAPRPKGFNSIMMDDCIHRVKHILGTAFQPPLTILHTYPFTDTSPQDVLIVAYHSIQNWLKIKGNSLEHDLPYRSRRW